MPRVIAGLASFHYKLPLFVIYSAVICIVSGADVNVDEAPHAFYVSVIEIHHEADSAYALLSVKIFSDDLQVGVQSFLESDKAPGIDQLCSDMSERTRDFLQSHIALNINNEKRAELHHVDCAMVGETHVITFRTGCPSSWEKISLEATYLMDVYPTQTQMVHITSAGRKYTTRLTNKTRVSEIPIRD